MKLSYSLPLLAAALGMGGAHAVAHEALTNVQVKVTTGDVCDADPSWFSGHSDAYVKVWLKGTGLDTYCGKTAYKANEGNPSWNEVFDCGQVSESQYPVYVYMEGWDYDSNNADDSIGKGADGYQLPFALEGWTGEETLSTSTGSGCGTSKYKYKLHQTITYMPPNPTSYGDPHFKTWGNQIYDFHGGCDLVLLTCPDFEHGLGLNVHVRTKIHSWWSSIETAVVQLGEHTLEITGGKQKIGYYLDGEYVEDMETGDAALGDFPVHFRRVNEHQSQTRIELPGYGNALSIESWGHFIRVNVKAPRADRFKGSLGMMGSFETGLKVARDGTTVIADPTEMGMEWQVRPTDGKLFHAEGEVQHPQACAMPEVAKTHRRLGEASITEEDAERACSHVSDKVERQGCVADVLATNDKATAGAY